MPDGLDMVPAQRGFDFALLVKLQKTIFAFPRLEAPILQPGEACYHQQYCEEQSKKAEDQGWRVKAPRTDECIAEQTSHCERDQAAG